MNFPTRLPLAAHKTYNVVRFLLKLCNHIDPRPSRLICNFWTAPSRPHPGPILHRPAPVPPRLNLWTAPSPSHPGTISGPTRPTPVRFLDRPGSPRRDLRTAPAYSGTPAYLPRTLTDIKGWSRPSRPGPPKNLGLRPVACPNLGLVQHRVGKIVPISAHPEKKAVLPACLYHLVTLSCQQLDLFSYRLGLDLFSYRLGLVIIS